MTSIELIQSLSNEVNEVIIKAKELNSKKLEYLSWKENETSWSILECLEHLNLYGAFYIPQIEKVIKHSNSKPDINFRNGFLGNYFAKSMLPKERLNKMKTFKDKNPVNLDLQKTVIDNFINQQIKLLNLLNQSKSISLGHVKIKTSFSSLIKMNLGNTFQFLINHMIRHFIQIKKIEHILKNIN